MNRQDWKNLWLLLRDIGRKEKGTLLNTFVMVVSQALMPYISIVGIGILLDGVYAGTGRDTLVRYVLGIFLGTLLCTVLNSRTRENFNRVRDAAKDKEAGDMNRKSLAMDYEYLEDTRVQELRSRTFAKSRFGVKGWFLLVLQGTLIDVVSILLAFGIVLPGLAGNMRKGMEMSVLGACAVLCGIVAVMLWVNYRMSIHYAVRANELQEALDGCRNRERYFMEMLSGVESQKDLRINRQGARIDREMEEAGRKMLEIRKQINIIRFKKLAVSMAFSNLLVFLVYAMTGMFAFRGIISIGNVVVFAASIVKMAESFNKMVNVVGELKEASLLAADYLEYMALEKRKPMGRIPLEKRRDNRFSISFEHVSFRYPGTDTDVIHDLNLSFEIGERMAIVGKNGSGKTTFIKLLCRLYDVTEGVIKVNGIDIRKYDYEEYCNLFSVVFQDFAMFAFPIGENIAASDQVDEEKALDALDRVGLWSRFLELPEGLSTYVGKEFRDEGVNFSGGERQKLAIARAIYKDAPFVIMDEPTAALDPLAECEVYEGFDRMVGNKTAIYISHRLASCRFCQDIMVFDKGKVVQRGSHEQLKEQEGLYRQLWDAQAQYYG